MEDKEEEIFVDGSGMTGGKRFKLYLMTHYRGILMWLIPIFLLPIIARKGVEKSDMAIYTYLVMALFFLTQITYVGNISLFPVFMYPLLGVFGTVEVCRCYFHDVNAIFMSYTALTVGFQASKLDRRMAFGILRLFGVSHERLLLGVCMTSMVMGATLNTYSASLVMAPVVQEVLQTLYEENVTPIPIGKTQMPTDLTAYYHILAANSVSIGGIGMLFGSVTNYCIRANFNSFYPTAPDAEQFTMLKFSLFTIPTMLLISMINYIYMVVTWMRRDIIATPFNDNQRAGIHLALKKKREELGPFTFHEWAFSILYIVTIVLSFSRMPGITRSWGEVVQETFEPPKKVTSENKPEDTSILNYFRDAPVIALGMTLAFMIPRNIEFLRMCKAKKKPDLPASITTPGLITWKLLNDAMHWDILYLLEDAYPSKLESSYKVEMNDFRCMNRRNHPLRRRLSYALGSNAAIARASEVSKLTEKFSSEVRGSEMSLAVQWMLVVLFVVVPMLLANVAPNSSVATVLIPISILLGKGLDLGPVVMPLATGLACAMPFLWHVGSPSLYNTKKVVNLPAGLVFKVGIGTTAIAILVLLFVIYIHSEVFWDVSRLPEWSKAIFDATPTPAPAG